MPKHKATLFPGVWVRLAVLAALSVKVELTNMPGRSLIDEASVRVKGIGHCVILHISYSDKPKDVKPEPVRRLVKTFSRVPAA